MLDFIAQAIANLTGLSSAGVLAALGAAILAAVGFSYVKGRGDGKASGAAADAAAYRETRKEIDNADLGIGATDRQRIERLRDIADRRGKR